MAVTANQVTQSREGRKGTGPIAAATTIYDGTLCFNDASGRIVGIVAAGVNTFAGLATEEFDNSAGAAEALDAEFFCDRTVLLTGSGFTQGTVGSDIYASDNYTITTSSSSTSYIGRCVAYESATQVWVKLRPGGEPQNISEVDLDDDEEVVMGTGDDVAMLFSTGDASNHAFVIAIDNTSQQLHITDLGAKATDWNRSAGTHPELAIHSNTTPATDYLSIGNHDGTTATIDVVGGTTFNLDIAGTTELIVTAAQTTVPGMLVSAESIPNTAGVGITGTADSFVVSVQKFGTIIKTTILIEVDGLNSGGTANDVVGADGAGVAHLGQITAAVNGTIFAGKITCLETPTGGDPDIDLWYTDDASGVEDTDVAAMANQIQCINHGDWTGAEVDVLTAFPPANKYMYLTTGDATDATYTAGILLIELYGK